MAPKPKKSAKKARSTIKSKNKLISESLGPNDLPAEPLALIFKFVYSYSMTILDGTPAQKCRPGGVYRDEPSYLAMQIPDHSHMAWRPTPVDVEKHGVAAFSYQLHHLRRVCQRWKGVIESLPEFYTRLVVLLDDPDPVAQLKKQLGRTSSSGLPLDILVTLRMLDSDNSESGADEEDEEAEIEQESGKARLVMKRLSAVIYRCRSFVFDVKHSSSLPLISQFFRGHAKNLRVLKLQCQVDDNNDAPLPAVPKIAAKDEFKFPLLTTVVLDGYTFMDACRLPFWTKQLKTISLDSLSISYISPPDEEEFDLYNLCQNISDIGFIRHLTLAYCNVGHAQGTVESGDYEPKVDCVTLIGHDIAFAEEFVSVTFGSTFCYYHISGTGVDYDSMSRAHHLRLEDVPNDNKNNFRFFAALGRFYGNRLDIVDCEGFTDEHLLAIAETCEPLRRLYLIDCPSITVKGIKAMVFRRNEIADQSDEDEEDDEEDNGDSDAESFVECNDEDDQVIDEGYSMGGYSSNTKPRAHFPYQHIRRLRVKGHPTKLSKADVKWFKQRVKYFKWN